MMDRIIINYKYSKNQKMLSIIVGLYTLLYTGYNLIALTIDKVYNINFYIAILGVVLGLVLILKVTIFSAKPIFIMDAEEIYSKAGVKKNIFQTKWESIRKVAIGLSYLKITEVGGKLTEVDLSELKYSDLKEIKSRIIELCEAKMISYEND